MGDFDKTNYNLSLGQVDKILTEKHKAGNKENNCT